MICSHYNALREKLLSELDLTNHSPKLAFKILMQAKSKQVAIVFSKYVTDCYKIRF